MNDLKNCNYCSSKAECICFECLNYFCDACFKIIHDLKKVNHKKEKIDPFIPLDIKCENHPRGILDFFYVDEKGTYHILFLYLIIL